MQFPAKQLAGVSRPSGSNPDLSVLLRSRIFMRELRSNFVLGNCSGAKKNAAAKPYRRFGVAMAKQGDK